MAAVTQVRILVTAVLFLFFALKCAGKVSQEEELINSDQLCKELAKLSMNDNIHIAILYTATYA